MIYGNYIGRNKYEVTHTLDGGNFSAVPWVSGLINGKGRYIDKMTGKPKTETPFFGFKLKRSFKESSLTIPLSVL